MTRNLFIVTDDGVFMGRDNFHKNLAKDLEIDKRAILGGGVFDQRTKKGTIIFFGKSFDFGKFDTELLQHFINEGKVFWYIRPLTGHEFEIDEVREEKESDAF